VRCRFADIAFVLAVTISEDAQDTELVALRVGHDDPALVTHLTDVGSASPQGLEPSHLGVAVIRSQIEMEPVLDPLGVRDA